MRQLANCLHDDCLPCRDCIVALPNHVHSNLISSQLPYHFTWTSLISREL